MLNTSSCACLSMSWLHKGTMCFSGNILRPPCAHGTVTMFKLLHQTSGHEGPPQCSCASSVCALEATLAMRRSCSFPATPAVTIRMARTLSALQLSQLMLAKGVSHTAHSDSECACNM